MNKKILSVLILILVVCVGILFRVGNKGFSFGGPEFNSFSSGVTNSSVALNPSVITEVLAVNTGRIYALVCNDDASNVAYLHLVSATTSVAVSEGINLGVGDCFEIGVDNLYVGRVLGIAAATTTLTIIEK